MTDSSSRLPSPSAALAVESLVGKNLNHKFTLDALIAKGGMGAVFRARQAPLGRLCAVKIMSPRTGNEQPGVDFHRRFFLEASTAAKLTHPNTVTIFDYGKTDDDYYYMAMELLEGRTLGAALKEAGALEEDRAVQIGLQICRSLREAHANGVVHRDIKPANIFLVKHGDEEDFVKVLDFGLVKDVGGEDIEDMTQAGVFMGSPRYMSPEQIQGQALDARTDIYSLGVLLFEMLTGRVPFEKSSSIEILMAHMREDPPSFRSVNPQCNASPGIEMVVRRCLAKDREARFDSMDALLLALKNSAGLALTGALPALGGTSDALLANLTSQPPPGGTTGHHISLVQSTTQSLPAPAVRPFSRKLVVATVICAAALAAIGVVWVRTHPTTTLNASRSEPSPSASATTVMPTSPPPEPIVSSVSPPVAPAGVVVHVTVNPEGASITTPAHEVLCSSAPCDVTIPAEQKDLVMLVSKPGFLPVLRTLTSHDSSVMVWLAKAGGSSGASHGSGKVKGYKEDPFAAPPY